jgi:HEAT repeat protein
VPRGVALVLLGDAYGVLSIKQAFADPASRQEALEALAVIGTGRAGEDEILDAALADASPDIRRRGVEVAAAIDRRQGKGTHATILRTALADQSFDVRSAVMRECATLDPAAAASIFAGALVDKDPAFRRVAESAMLELSGRAPGPAADAVRVALRSPDAMARRTALGLLERIATHAPGEAAAALTQIAADEKAPEEARIAALQYLRRTGVPPTKLQPLLEKAVGPEASPRLRAAALPLYARLLDAEKAQELAVAESKGSAAARATGAAVWGAVAARQPDAAAKPLKGFLYDPSPEVRIEAARSFGFLRRDGAVLIGKALLDGNGEVQRAAVDAAVTLAGKEPYAAGELLSKAVRNVRPPIRRAIVEALGRIGQDRPQVAVVGLAHILKEGDSPTRAAVAGTFCALARKNAGAASPYLRVAARDADREVRTAAASCLGSLTEGDPKGAARIAAELASADEPSVRAAAAASLGVLTPRARDLTLAPLIKLLQDDDHTVRLAAVEAIAAVGKGKAPLALGKRAEEVERALANALGQGKPDERLAVIRTSARLNLAGLLRQAAGDKDEAVRLEALHAAAETAPPALEVIQQLVEDRSSAVRAEAIRQLATVSGDGAGKVLPIFTAMLRSGDPATRRAGVTALGDLAGVDDTTTRLLAEILRQRGEAVRAAAAESLGRIADRAPERAAPLLEQALGDPAHDVRMAAVRGLARVWARQRSPAQLAAVLAASETDSARRLVSLEALVTESDSADRQAAARTALEQVATSGPPLARLFAQIGRAFISGGGGGKPAEMHAFVDKLLGGY